MPIVREFRVSVVGLKIESEAIEASKTETKEEDLQTGTAGNDARGSGVVGLSAAGHGAAPGGNQMPNAA